jgi:hypothetical protein
MERSLKLSEKLFCLTVNPKNGGILLSASSALGITLTGSVFVELMNKKIISIQNGLVHVQNTGIQADEIHDFFMRHLRVRKKDRKLRRWISFFNIRRRKIQRLFIRSLVRKDVLRTEEKRILFIPYEKVYIMNRDLIESVRAEVENAALGIGNPTEESLILAVLVLKSNLLRRIFPERSKRKQAVRYLKEMPETDISKAVQEAIQMMRAAVYVATS